MRPLLLLLAATLIWAADVTGSWSGPIEMTRDGETRSSTALLELKQEGAKVVIDGDDLTLEEEGPHMSGKINLERAK